MKHVTYSYPKSSFLSVDKDMNLIISKLCTNERLKKLLYYTDKNALSQPNLTDEQMISMMGKNIKNIPKLKVDGDSLIYLVISFDSFMPNNTNPQFRNNVIELDIICHFDQWNLKDFELRPYKIAAELDSMLDGQHLTGIGDVEFASANEFVQNDEFAGLCLIYTVIHGEEDKKYSLNPQNDASIINNYNKIFNNNPWNQDQQQYV